VEKTECIQILEKIKNNNINLYNEKKILAQLKPQEKKLAEIIITYNLDGILPNKELMLKECGFSGSYMDNYLPRLRERMVVIDPTIIELLCVFGVFKKRGHRYLLGFEEPIISDLESLKGLRGGSSWTKRFKNPRATCYHRYYVALVKRRRLPVYKDAFPKGS
jgi:hypothetical protein